MARQQMLQIFTFTSLIVIICCPTSFGCSNGIPATVALTGTYYPPATKQSPFITYGVSFTYYSELNSILLVGKVQNVTYDGTATQTNSLENSIPSNWAITGKCKLFIDYNPAGNTNAAGTLAQVFDNNGNNGTVYFFGTSITIAGLNGVFVLSS